MSNSPDLSDPVFRMADQARPPVLPWLWPDRIPIGALTLLVGDPAVGKSILATDLGRYEEARMLLAAYDRLGANVMFRSPTSQKTALDCAGLRLEMVQLIKQVASMRSPIAKSDDS